MASWEENLQDSPKFRIIFDDSGSQEYRAWLLRTYGQRYSIVYFSEQPIGQTRMIQSIFAYLANFEIEYVLEIEEDWVLFRKLDLTSIFAVMEQNPQLVQMRLSRTIWYADHHILDLNAGSLLLDYIRRSPAQSVFHDTWFEIRSDHYFFSHNPNLFKRELLAEPYLESEDHEHSFGISLMRKYSAFGVWADNPYDGYVTHIGIRNRSVLESLETHERREYG